MAEIRDEYRPLESLKPHSRNYNHHPPEQVAKLATKIRAAAFTAPFIIREDGTILGGHARRLALLSLKAECYPAPEGVREGWQVPCRVFRGNAAQELALLAGDNPDSAALDYDTAALTALLADLQADGALEWAGYDDARLDELIGELAGEGAGAGVGTSASGPGVDPHTEWDGMPEYVHEDKTAFQSIAIHFKDQEAVEAFSALVEQKITPHTRYLWYPEIEIETYADKRYAPESEVSGLHHLEGEMGEPTDEQGI